MALDTPCLLPPSSPAAFRFNSGMPSISARRVSSVISSCFFGRSFLMNTFIANVLTVALSTEAGDASDSLTLSSSLGLSHDKQTVSDFGFRDVHTEHFHCVICSAKMLPHPFEGRLVT